MAVFGIDIGASGRPRTSKTSVAPRRRANFEIFMFLPITHTSSHFVVHIGPVLARFGAVLELLGAMLGLLGTVLRSSWSLLKVYKAFRSYPGASWGHLGAILGPSQDCFGAILRACWGLFGRSFDFHPIHTKFKGTRLRETSYSSTRATFGQGRAGGRSLLGMWWRSASREGPSAGASEGCPLAGVPFGDWPQREPTGPFCKGHSLKGHPFESP